MEAKSPSGPPWEGEISLGNSPGASPEVHHEFFFGPGPPGAIREPTGRAKLGSHVAVFVFPPPGGSGERFGVIFARVWLDFGAFFGTILK